VLSAPVWSVPIPQESNGFDGTRKHSERVAPVCNDVEPLTASSVPRNRDADSLNQFDQLCEAGVDAVGEELERFQEGD